MFKKIISIIAAAVMLLTVTGVSVSAASGDGWEFDEATGTLTISANEGTTAWQGVITDTDTVTSVVIEEGVTEIGNRAFSNCTALENVILPNTLQTIGDRAFANCIQLTEITVPGGVEAIGFNVFNSCRSLAKVTLSEGVKRIEGGSTFANCSALTEVNLPNSLTYIDTSSFSNCTNLTEIEIPENVTYIATGAFSNCSSLTQITYPNGATVVPSSGSAPTIPAAASQIKYSVSGGDVIINEIIPAEGSTTVDIPASIGGREVSKVDEAAQDKVSQGSHNHKMSTATCTQKSSCSLCGFESGDIDPNNHDYVNSVCSRCGAIDPNHTHTGGTATCTAKAECAVCGAEYGELLPHSYANGACTKCGESDPYYTPPAESGTTETESSVTDPEVTDPTGTSPTVTSPSIPSRPSYPSSPTTAATSETAVTTVTTTAEEEIIYDEQPDEDVAVGAYAYADNNDIPERSKGLIAFAAIVLIAASLMIKKRFF